MLFLIAVRFLDPKGEESSVVFMSSAGEELENAKNAIKLYDLLVDISASEILSVDPCSINIDIELAKL